MSSKDDPDARVAPLGKLVARLPPLLMVRAFEAVGRTGSMRKAADDIGVSHTVVSHHLRNLEGWLNASLIERSPRGVSLTPEGRHFFAAVSGALNTIAAAALEIRPQTRQGALRIWCMPGLASRWLTPRLSELERHLPGVEIILRAIDRLPDFTRYEADVMIVFGERDEVPPSAQMIVRPRIFPVVSPEWAAANPVPRSLQDLLGQPLLHEESRSQWRRWLIAAGVDDPGELTGPRLWNANLCLDAALAGQGMALTFAPMATDLIRNGQLIEVLETEVTLGAYFLVAPGERWTDPILAKFRKWIEQSLSGGEPR